MSNTRHQGNATGPLSHSDADPAPEATMSRDIINIPDNVLQRGTRDYDQRDQDDLQWLFSYATQELDGSRIRLCEEVDADWTTITRIASGTYGAAIANFMVKVRDLKARVMASAGATGFIDTMVSRKIHDVLDYALAGDIKGGKIVLITGSSRRGKTEAIQEWCRRNNHGRSVYVDAPESGGMRALLYEIAHATRVNKGRKTSDLRERVIDSFNRRRILIIDEIARLIPKGREPKIVELEFLRRLHDKTGCALALVATPVFEHLVDTARLHDYLEQLVGRIEDPLQIPRLVYRQECRDILKAFDAAGDDRALLDLAHQIANGTGKLGVLFALLRQAASLAKRKGVPISHAHLQAAYQRRQNRFTWPEKDV